LELQADPAPSQTERAAGLEDLEGVHTISTGPQGSPGIIEAELAPVISEHHGKAGCAAIGDLELWNEGDGPAPEAFLQATECGVALQWGLLSGLSHAIAPSMLEVPGSTPRSWVGSAPRRPLSRAYRHRTVASGLPR